jgi:hypothetical protein
MLNRTKALVLALFAVYWVLVVAILVAARAGSHQAVRLPGGNQGPVALGLLTALFALLSTGVIRGWRWTFWLILVAFLGGSLHVLAAALQLVGVMTDGGPAWYLLLQVVVGLLQFGIAVVMLAGYRKAGVWGA